MHASFRLAQRLLCLGLLVGSAHAADVNRCVSADGKVLLTDADCPQGSQSDAIDSGGAVAKSGSGDERTAAAMPMPAAQLPRSLWADLPRPLARRSTGRDAETLQAAHLTMQMQDEMRRQRHVAMLR